MHKKRYLSKISLAAVFSFFIVLSIVYSQTTETATITDTSKTGQRSSSCTPSLYWHNLTDDKNYLTSQGLQVFADSNSKVKAYANCISGDVVQFNIYEDDVLVDDLVATGNAVVTPDSFFIKEGRVYPQEGHAVLDINIQFIGDGIGGGENEFYFEVIYNFEYISKETGELITGSIVYGTSGTDTYDLLYVKEPTIEKATIPSEITTTDASKTTALTETTINCLYDSDCLSGEICLKGLCTSCIPTYNIDTGQTIACSSTSECSLGEECIQATCAICNTSKYTILAGTAPETATMTTLTDSDSDGMPDSFEDAYGLNKYDPADASYDPDNDFLINLDEYNFGTDPNNPDTDGNGVIDSQEFMKTLAGTAPETATITQVTTSSCISDSDCLSGEVCINSVCTLSTETQQKTLFDPNEGLVAWYTFDDVSSTTFKDSSSYANDGACLGDTCPTYTKNGFVGGAYTFDGINDGIDIPADGTYEMLDKFTISAWVKYNSQHSIDDGMIFRKDNNYGVAIAAIKDSTNLRFYFYADPTKVYLVNSQSGLNDNEWHYLLGAYDGAEIKFYIDGALAGSQSTLGEQAYYANNNLAIGKKAAENAAYFNGTIDEVKIWNKALTEDEIVNSYNSYASTKFTVKQPAVPAYCPNPYETSFKTDLTKTKEIATPTSPVFFWYNMTDAKNYITGDLAETEVFADVNGNTRACVLFLNLPEGTPVTFRVYENDLLLEDLVGETTTYVTEGSTFLDITNIIFLDDGIGDNLNEYYFELITQDKSLGNSGTDTKNLLYVKKPSLCITDLACSPEEFCDGGYCVLKTTKPDETILVTAPTCTSDLDCQQEEICVDNTCIQETISPETPTIPAETPPSEPISTTSGGGGGSSGGGGGTEAEIPGGTSVDSCSSLEGTICEPPQTCLNDDFTSYSYEGYCCLSSCGTDIYSPLTGNSYVTVYKCEDINNDGIIERHYTICERENEGDCENNPITDTEKLAETGFTKAQGIDGYCGLKEEATSIPIFSAVSLLISLMLLIIFYFTRKGFKY